MNLFGACFVLKQVEEGKKIPKHIVNEAKKIVAVAQAEFITLKAQINNWLEGKGECAVMK